MESAIFGLVWAIIFFGIFGTVIYQITTFTNGRSFDDYKRDLAPVPRTPV